jgi:hypothetical protein
MKIIVHEANGLQIGQRWEDGYINATQMCQAHDEEWYQYWRLPSTQEYVNALAKDLGVPVIVNNPNRNFCGSALVVTFRGGNSQQGTWVHPEVAIDLAAWISVEFRILVNRWVFEWMVTGRNPVSSQPVATATDLQLGLEELEKLIISIRSQARTIHIGSHQPADEILFKSLHSLSHHQLAAIAAAIQHLQMLKQVAQVAQLDRLSLDTEIPASQVVDADLPSTASFAATESGPLFSSRFPIRQKEASVRLSVELPNSTHRKLSILAAKTGRNKAEIVRMLLEQALKEVEDD